MANDIYQQIEAAKDFKVLEKMLAKETVKDVLATIVEKISEEFFDSIDAKSVSKLYTHPSPHNRWAALKVVSICYDRQCVFKESASLLKDNDSSVRSMAFVCVLFAEDEYVDKKLVQAYLKDPKSPPEVAVLLKYVSPEEARKHSDRIRKVLEGTEEDSVIGMIRIIASHNLKEFAKDIEKRAKDYPAAVVSALIDLEAEDCRGMIEEYAKKGWSNAQDLLSKWNKSQKKTAKKPTKASSKSKKPAIFKSLLEEDQNDLVEKLEECAKLAIRLLTKKVAEKSIKVGASKLGGQPDLAGNIDWPESEQGELMAFVAQINLSDLAKIQKTALPSSGMLYFFVDEENYLGAGPDVIKVMYSKEKPAKLKRRTFPKELPKSSRFLANAIKAEKYLSFPSLQSDAIRELSLSPEEKYAYEEFLHQAEQDEFSADHHMFGFANVINAGDIGGEGLSLLLQVSSAKNTGIKWASGGRMYFLIGDEELENEEFETAELQFRST
ncbi:MAG: YwqG family protein [Pseudobdellovibrionaceae bacterium]